MPVSRQVLGMNARNFLYIRRHNRRKYKLMADDKLQTKLNLIKRDVPTPQLIESFSSLKEVRAYDWTTLPRSFVIKPARGYGGRGISVVTKWDGYVGQAGGRQVTREDLESDIFSILDGAHSLKGLPDEVLLERKVRSHSFFKKYTSKGVPDIRVIVFNHIPVMAMLRLPTVYSDGKANLHLGAIGIGIDIRTGITTFGVSGGRRVKNIPGKKIKVQGIKLPDWNEILYVAVKAQRASKLGFVGVDIVLDEKYGPLVLEVNARPGLSIQVANQESLRTRLERIEDLDITTDEQGVTLGQKLFAEQMLQSVEESNNMLGVIEKITIFYGEDKKKTVRAKIDTGAYRTSIDADLVHELGLDKHNKYIHVRSGSGRQRRHTVRLSMKLKGKNINTIATYTERSHLRFPIIIGRRDLKGFFVDPTKIPEGVKVK